MADDEDDKGKRMKTLARKKQEISVDGELWVDKEQGMRMLGCSKRTFERFMQAAIADGRVESQHLPPGPRRPFRLTVYRELDVRRLLEERQNEARLLPVARNAPPQTQLAVAQAKTYEELPAFLAGLSQFVETLNKQHAPSPAAFAYIGLKEAGKLIGMPPAWVRSQIENGRLPAELVGARWKVRRCDLEALPPRRYEQKDDADG